MVPIIESLSSLFFLIFVYKYSGPSVKYQWSGSQKKKKALQNQTPEDLEDLEEQEDTDGEFDDDDIDFDDFQETDEEQEQKLKPVKQKSSSEEEKKEMSNSPRIKDGSLDISIIPGFDKLAEQIFRFNKRLKVFRN